MSGFVQKLRFRLLILAKDFAIGSLTIGILSLCWYFATKGASFVAETTQFDPGWLTETWQKTILGVSLLLAFVLTLGRIVEMLIGQRLATTRGFRRLVRSSERLVTEISPTESRGFKVVLVSLGPDPARRIAILTSVLEDAESGRKLATIFLPNTPNVRAGETLVVEHDRLTLTSWSVSDAMTFLMSGGAVAPSKIHFDKSASE